MSLFETNILYDGQLQRNVRKVKRQEMIHKSFWVEYLRGNQAYTNA